MKFGSVKCQGVLIDGKMYFAPKNGYFEIGGIDIANIKEIVINHVKHIRQADGTWTQKGARRDINLAHDQMVHKAKNAEQNRKVFNVWASDGTVNICNKALRPYPESNKESKESNKESKESNSYSYKSSNY